MFRFCEALEPVRLVSPGTAPNLFRAPGSDWSPWVEALAISEGLTPLKRSVDPKDRTHLQSLGYTFVLP